MMKNKNSMLNMILCVVMLFMAASGIILHITDGKMWAILHSISGCLFVILAIVHIFMHRPAGEKA